MPQNRKKTGERGPDGRFVRGVSGNPGGRPKSDPEAESLLLSKYPAAVKLWVDTMENPEARLDLRIACADRIVERVMGKAAQPILADVFQAEEPLTLDEMFSIAEEVLHEAGGPAASP